MLDMVRGTTPRQPSKAGRQAGVHPAKPLKTVTSAKTPKHQESAPSAANAPRKPTVLGTKSAKKSSKAGVKIAAPAAKTPAGYNPVAPDRIAEILRRLDAAYPAATCALQHKSAWELLAATILSAQCTDARVNMVTPELFRKYPTVRDFAALTSEELEPEIKSTGFFRNKAKSLVGSAQKIVDVFGGKVPETMEELLILPGVARKTANVLLGTWFHKADGVVVDTHVHRISRRLELTANDDTQKIEQDLMRSIPREHWISFAHQVILHGRALCVARQPKCADCPLENICHAADKTWSTVDIHKNAKP